MATRQSRIDSTEASSTGRLDGNGARAELRTQRVEVQTERTLIGGEPAVTDLIKQLASEGGDLVRSELALAKLEMREMAQDLARSSAKVAAAIGLALTGVLVLLAAMVIGLGILLGGGAGNYALSALIIGGLFVVIGGVMARSGLDGLKNPPKPEQTVESVQETKDWASREAREFSREVRSS